ncbi:MAG TPA: DUF4446 family protein [Nevskiaceae bacterium]|nr:DUF4446 family protein [Nevskiaceae bacterium]
MLLNYKDLGFILFGFLTVWLVALSIIFYRLFSHYQKLTKGITKKDLKSVLEKLLKSSNEEHNRINELTKKLEKLEKDGFYHIQKIGLVRFNPFAETGGDQSFCLAVLDNHDSGFVISSLHSRDKTRFYAKPVKNGQPVGYELSKEETRAIKKAKKVR